ncbi:4'-phosphopantetheinyl transferase family protein [Glutamicibacter sp.]|jgi:Phosphopantetheinyl transferase|uniref:4'-phosphopantetheinyl transferase family protein n=1 Tax=Glutamicibacter sp. TaxID=1931995 RepID=UPI002B4A47E9|nr:4'-phosphopantetheinyl transferase superfamily protein [Glutamicibacter sp.]HJX78850.1 4'-phosphopantetheinyl transferase superfamily protein [Glutamicibacter sp.]
MTRARSDSQIFYAVASPGQVQLAAQKFGGPEKILGAEASRAEDFAHREDREAFIGSRTLLRLLLSYLTYGELDQASAVDISRHCISCNSSSHGKPTTPQHAISSSRTRELVIAAVAPKGLLLGVDIERGTSLSPPGVFPGFDQLALTSNELKRVHRDKSPDYIRLLAWTAKEALLKADGAGLRREPSTVQVLSASVMRATRLNKWASPRHLAGYSLRRIPVPSTHVASLAASKPLPIQELSAEIFNVALS